MLLPRDTADLIEIIADAASNRTRIEFCGGGTRSDFGAPRAATLVSLRQMSGIVDYDPAELVLTALPGTPLKDVASLVAAEGQMLAFEPWGAEGATIGGTVAAGGAGSRRLTAGSARDHLLAFKAVSGRAEAYLAGAKVVKNVTGYDLPKLMAGSWGRIGVMTELTLKVLPSPRQTVTMVARNLDPRAAYSVMACALGSNAEVSAAACLRSGEVLLRLAGFAPSVESRCASLPGIVASQCALVPLPDDEAARLWSIAMTGEGLSGQVRWDVHLPARNAAELVGILESQGSDWAMDWGGGRVWLATDRQDDLVRAVAARLGGEARLVQAPPQMRQRIPAFHPRQPGVMALEQRVRLAFDPSGIFATGRFVEDADADQFSA